jgi:hypothetical protein
MKSIESEKKKSLPNRIILISNQEERHWMILIRNLLILILMLQEIQMTLPIALINLKVLPEMITWLNLPKAWVEKLIKDL